MSLRRLALIQQLTILSEQRPELNIYVQPLLQELQQTPQEETIPIPSERGRVAKDVLRKLCFDDSRFKFLEAINSLQQMSSAFHKQYHPYRLAQAIPTPVVAQLLTYTRTSFVFV